MTQPDNRLKKPYVVVTFIGVLGIILLALFLTQGDKSPIKVGFIGNLTGGMSHWGVGPRNGALLAIEAVNETGGIDGRVIEFITKDDRLDPKLAAQATKELIDEGVVAIIGPTSSASALAAVPAANERKMLLIGPTVSTAALAGKDDFFFRTAILSSLMMHDLALYLYNEKKWRTVAAAYETKNRAYSEDAYNSFKKSFEKLGGSVMPAVEFKPGSGHTQIAKSLTAQTTDGIYLVAGDIDTAYICQELRKQGSKLPVAEAGTAVTEDLIHHGGHAVEGIMVPQVAFVEPGDINFQPFRDRYTDRYGEEPSNIPGYGYDAANVLIAALKKSKERTPAGLKKTILQTKRFESVFGDFEYDGYGEVQRKTAIITVKNGKFVKVR